MSRRRESTNAIDVDERPRRRLFRRRDRAEPALGPSSVTPLVSQFSATFDPSVAGLYAGYSPTALLDKVGTAARCLQLCAQAVASMPLRYRRSTPAPNGRDYSPPWISSPDPAWFPNGIGDVIFASVFSMYAQGDAFLYATSRDATGYPATFTVLDPLSVKVEADGGTRQYKYANTPIDAGDVLQISRAPTGALRGAGALQAYASNLTALYQADDYARDMFGGGGMPPGLLKSARRLTSEQALEVKTEFASRFGPGLPAVIPPDIDFQEVAFSPRDLALLESREFDTKQIAAAFGVPSPLLNLAIEGGLTYQNPSALFDLWWRSELKPGPAARIEEALARWLPRGSWVEFDSAQTLKPDLPTLVSAMVALYGIDAVTSDEVRAYCLDLPPLSQGEALADIDEPPGAGSSVGSESAPVPLEVVQ